MRESCVRNVERPQTSNMVVLPLLGPRLPGWTTGEPGVVWSSSPSPPAREHRPVRIGRGRWVMEPGGNADPCILRRMGLMLATATEQLD